MNMHGDIKERKDETKVICINKYVTCRWSSIAPGNSIGDISERSLEKALHVYTALFVEASITGHQADTVISS